MNKLTRYVVIIAITTVVLFLAWYFSSIITSIIISAILALIGKPIMEFLTSIKIGKYKINNGLAAFITMSLIVSILLIFIIFLAPLVGQIFRELDNINPDDINQKLKAPFYKYNEMLHHIFPTMDRSITLEIMLAQQFDKMLDFNLFTHAFNSVAAFLMHFAVSAFTVVFVTFFFLKDNDTVTNIVLTFVPEEYEQSAKRALDGVNKLLSRYFTGISIETILITILNTIGLYFIVGVDFRLSIVIAFLSGVLNIMPYIGPIFAGLFGTLVGVISCYGGDVELGILVLKLVLVFFTTHMIDVAIFQPYIYSNSVKAHPLEIFLIILVAGNIGGIVGMLVAIPAYTVIRVFAKEFLSRFKFVQKLTNRLDNN